MGGPAVSPGGALLRSSRMFSIPKPLPVSSSASTFLGEQRASATMTKAKPRHQTITSPLRSRQKGDWGLKRPLPLKTTMATTTPLLRINEVDTVENITDFQSAADHSLSLEKFQELRIPMSIPRRDGEVVSATTKKEDNLRSVFEEESDFTDVQDTSVDQRWKFKGPWLAQMADGDFLNYLNKKVRPQRVQFRALLRERLAERLTSSQNRAAVESGKPTPEPIKAEDLTEEQFSDYIRSLRNDRVTLYALVSKFLDLPPLGTPIGFAQNNLIFSDGNQATDKITESPYGKSGPPPSHPSGGIGYLRTGAFMENHAVYGPQAKKTPIQARVVSPRIGPSPAKLGVGGFVATVPVGANEFNVRSGSKFRRPLANGINNLDISTYGGAKAYIEPFTATVDPEGKVVVQVRETSPEAQLIAKEMRGLSSIYNDSELKRTIPQPEPVEELPQQELHDREVEGHAGEAELQDSRVKQVYDQMLSEEQNVLSNSSSYGLDAESSSEPPSETK
ncbi:unnamed protein product [Clonostachys rosea]|uniref:37S ribosomal protein mrp51, mitochondrial n=1 Tax=Bionectria ochroleuca TaxID=29856 RepID=A0ABY6V5D8_BIOOC|nr:unnamed protein product [Clonostachys rosea]